MPDEIIKELWAIKDTIAREHGYDLEALVKHLQQEQKARGGQVVDRRAMKKAIRAGNEKGTKSHAGE